MVQRITPKYLHTAGAALIALTQGTEDDPATLEHVEKKLTVVPYYWNPTSLAYEVARQTSTSVGGGVGGSTVIDANLTSAGSTKAVGYFTLNGQTSAIAVDATLSSGGSTRQVGLVGQSTPGSSANYFWTKSVDGAAAGSTKVDINSISSSTAHLGDVSISNPTTSVTLSNPTTAVDATLSSAGSTRLVGKVDINSVSSSTAHLGDMSISSGTVSLSSQITVTVGNPTTAVDLSSNGSTRLVGKVDVNSVSSSTGHLGDMSVSSGTVTLASGSTALIVGSVTIASGSTAFLAGAVAVSSGVVLGAGSTANSLGSVALVAGSSANTVGSVALVAGTSANLVGGVVINSGTTAITVGSVALLPGSSANTIGNVAQGPGSSANFWFGQSIPFSSGNLARSTVNTSVDISVLAANANRKALVIANLSTVQIVGLGLSTGAVTTGLTNINLFLSPNSQLAFGCDQLPLFTGPVRGINISSTAVAGGVGVMEFT